MGTIPGEATAGSKTTAEGYIYMHKSDEWK